MNKNQTVQLNIEGIGMNGEGVAHCDGLTVFVKNALPGESVSAKIVCVKSRLAYAIAQSHSEYSAVRVSPTCPLFFKCGGCTLQHVDYASQLESKKKSVQSAFAKAHVTAKVGDVVPSNKVFRYRNKMSLPVAMTDGKTQIGLYALNSHRVVACDDCMLQPEWNSVIIALFGEFLRSSGLTGYDEKTRLGEIRHLVVRELGGKMQITVVATKKIDVDGFVRLLEERFADFNLFLNINRADNNVILGDKWIKVYGDEQTVDVCGLKVKPHPAGFFQVNDYIRDKIYCDVAAVMARAQAKTIIDAYSGAGIMTAMLSRCADKVIGIEINAQATQSALALARENGIDNMSALLGDVKDVLPTLKAEKDNCAVVLDPPRSGCDRAVLDTVVEFAPKNIVYVSCNPSTLARDLAILSPYYDVDFATPYDMFPMTDHVETLVVLSKMRD